MIEVVPLVSLKKIPQAPPGVAGIFNYHGQPVPVIDLSELTIGIPAQARVSTRIILINYSAACVQALPVEAGVPRNAAARRSDLPVAILNKPILGLMAEQTSETIRRGKSDFMSAGVSVKTAPYLGAILMDSRGIIQ